jgi:PDZ domain
LPGLCGAPTLYEHQKRGQAQDIVDAVAVVGSVRHVIANTPRRSVAGKVRNAFYGYPGMLNLRRCKMVNRTIATFAAGALLALQCAPVPAYAENRMGYRLLSAQEAALLPHNHGALGMDVERAQQITDDGMTFDIIRVKQVRRGSPGAQAGFSSGDQIIALDGRVFASIQAFAAYVGSVSPGSQVNVDYIPAGGGPGQAQRVAVTIGGAGGIAQSAPQNGQSDKPASTGMSTRTKIGLGAAALLGCYELGCFSSRSKTGGPVGNSQQAQPSYGTQQQ